MSRRGSFMALVLASGLLPPGPAVWAQRHSGATARQPHPARADSPETPARTPIDEFETMAPAEQQQALQRLPPADRKKLQQRIEKFNQLPPQQQRTLKNLYNRLHQLPADRQNAVRKAIHKFSLQPAGRQAAIREELRGLAIKPEPDRLTRMASPDFQRRFNGQERDIVRDMSPLLPPK